MQTPGEKKFSFKNDQNQKLEVVFSIAHDKLSLSTELQENILNKKKYTSVYSFEEVKEKNKFFFLCQGINDVLNQLEILLKDDNKANFKIGTKEINLIIPTNMPLAPQILFEIKEIEKDINMKVEELNDYIIKTEKNSENNFALLLKENKEMKEKICNLENQLKLLNLNFGFLPNYYFDKIKEWIGGDKDKIGFNFIFKLNDNDKDRDRFQQSVNLSCPQIFIFITENLSIFGSYCPKYYTSSIGNWISDGNTFLFSLNLDKKYPAKKAQNNYHIGTCGYHFNDITFCSFNQRKGTFDKGTYLDKYELDGKQNYFFIKHFLAYKVENL